MSDYGAVIFGRRGQGKSELLRRILLQWPTPAVIFDPLHEHHKRPQDYRYRPVGDLFEKVVDAAKLAYRCGLEVNPDGEEKPVRAVLLAVDEVDATIRHYGPGGIPRSLLEIAKYGRHRGVCFAYTARRPPDIPPALASQASDIFTFRQTSPVDLQYFHKLGIEPGVFRNLGDHEFVHLPPSGALHTHLSPWDLCSEGIVR